LQAKLRKEYGFNENAEIKARLMALADTNLVKGKWKPAGVTNSAKEVLFTLQGNGHLVKEFLRYVEVNQRPSTLAPEKYLDLLYQQFIDTTILKLLEERISVQHPEYRYLLQEYYEGILLFDVMEKEVWSKASLDSVGQQTYYEAHKTDYTSGERASVVFYSSTSSQFGDPLKQLILEWSQTKLEEFISMHNGIYYLAWLKDILPPGPMSFEEARPAVISDYQTFLEKNWVEQLKKKYSVKINEKGKQYILQQLQGKG
jgi:peptidyl-prolyl cis-trans isomerase SurA